MSLKGDSKGIIGEKKIPQTTLCMSPGQNFTLRKVTGLFVKVTLLQEIGNAGGGGVTVRGCKGLAQVWSVFQVCPPRRERRKNGTVPTTAEEDSGFVVYGLESACMPIFPVWRCVCARV